MLNLESSVQIGTITIPVIRYEAVVVGSGAAGLAAALHLAEGGVASLALVTENRLAGTSRNTGSDKQTYYKLSLAGDVPDSVGDMAATLFDGGCMDGDLARIEAALSTECFYRLCRLGVPFPRNSYGEAVGYKTDHDPKTRATSAGPLTSRLMVEALEHQLSQTSISMHDHWQVIRILTDDQAGKRVLGLLCLNRQTGVAADDRYRIILSHEIVYAVGGPAMLYEDSVYPASQMGGTGLALEAGAMGRNLTEWQYGLASVKPRWNVSGSYQQVLPRYLSSDQNGEDCRDFLDEWIPDESVRLGAIFRKGYQWPFDARKLDGSSLVDLLVFQETVLRGRRVYLDFRQNPGGGSLDFAGMDSEASGYLVRAGAVQDTPIERLRHLNQPAVDFYAAHGVNLASDLLEIRLCAQHHNGGLAADRHWQSNLRGLYPVGEVNGSHGIYRPGGSALNSGQVGALRAAAAILAERRQSPDALTSAGLEQVAERVIWLEERLARGQAAASGDQFRTCPTLSASWLRAVRRMSQVAGPFRQIEKLDQAIAETDRDMAELELSVAVRDSSSLGLLARYRELLSTQHVYLAAMLDYVVKGGGSRGSAIYLESSGHLPVSGLPLFFRCRPAAPDWSDRIQEVQVVGDQILLNWRPVLPLPHPDEAFETVWRNDRQAWHNRR